jgi:arsenite methyltransferase
MSEKARDDLLFQDDIRAAVRAAYSAIPTGAGRPVAERFYREDELAHLPESAISWALGVGNPHEDAELTGGEVVLDLGCAGIDTVLAARRVGPTGRAIGIDTLPEMCERAREAAREAEVDGWCEFRVGEMEDLPVEDASVDVIISNGVLNLSPRKSRALAEAARVLRPGGRLCIVDLTVEDDLPPEVLSSPAAWAGCIAGAISERVLIGKLERAGLTAVHTDRRGWFSVDDVALYPLFTPEVIDLMHELLTPDAAARVAVGVVATARKPEDR